MPKSHGQMFLRRTSPTRNEWLEAMEEWRGWINPFFKNSYFEKLGLFRCLWLDGSHQLNLAFNSPRVESSTQVNLGTRGVFGCSYSAEKKYQGTGHLAANDYEHSTPNGTRTIWGLTELGWMVAEIHFLGKPGVNGRGAEEATLVIANRVEAHSLLASARMSPEGVFHVLREKVREIRDTRKTQLEHASDAESFFSSIENMILGIRS